MSTNGKSGDISCSQRTKRRNTKSQSSLPIPLPDENLLEVANQVSSIEHLRETILDYAIADKNVSRRLQTIRTLRLVNKLWNSTTTKLFKTHMEPLFHLVLSKTNSLKGSPFVKKNEKILDQLCNCIQRSLPLVPTFSLKIEVDCFRKENHDSFSKLLVHCGAGLVHLHISIPDGGGSLKLIFPKFTLPRLKKLTVDVINKELRVIAAGEQLINHYNNVTYFVQDVLNATSILEEFVMPSTGDIYGCPDYELLSLPSSLITLDFDGCYFLESDLSSILTRNKLPNLSSLNFETPFPGRNNLGAIIGTFRGTLTGSL